MEERDFWLGFSAFSGIGPNRFGKLMATFGSAKVAWSARLADIQKTIGAGFGKQFDSFRKTFAISEYKNSLEKQHMWFITLADDVYPNSLKQIPNPPFVLYGKGNRELLGNRHSGLSRISSAMSRQGDSGVALLPRMTENCIAVVGSRKTTQYGRSVTESLVMGLSRAGLTIVSGLATGVDAVAHKTVLENHARTIAVLGCGVDCCYPAENQNIYNSILESGSVIISEQPLSHPPSKGSFPSRNRIIAGLSEGVLVTEGTEDSGSLITADYAFKFGRKVFAVPGPINSNLSQGPLKLIRKGAKMVGSAQEILSELQISNVKFPINTNEDERDDLTKDEKKILELLANENLHFDEIARRLKMNSSAAGTILTMMEIKGMIKNVDGAIFSIGTGA